MIGKIYDDILCLGIKAIQVAELIKHKNISKVKRMFLNVLELRIYIVDVRLNASNLVLV